MYSQIAANKRRTVIVVVLFFVIWLAIGGVLGLLFRAVARPAVTTGLGSAQPTNSGWTPVAVGIVIGGLVALVGILYSLTAGAKLVLRASGAVPADAAQYQQLHNLVEALAIGEGIPKPAVYVIDDPSPNAFATGVSPDKAAITYTTGLLAIMNREELEGVTSHEMSHIKNHDIRLLLVVSTMIGLAALLASILWRTAFWGSIGDENGGGLLPAGHGHSHGQPECPGPPTQVKVIGPEDRGDDDSLPAEVEERPAERLHEPVLCEGVECHRVPFSAASRILRISASSSGGTLVAESAPRTSERAEPPKARSSRLPASCCCVSSRGMATE